MSDRIIEIVMKRLDDIEARLVRVESRIVQLLNHMGIKPKGALSEAERKRKKETRE